MTTPVGSIRLDLTIDGSNAWEQIERQVRPVLNQILADTQRRLDAIEREQREAARAAERSAAQQVTSARRVEDAVEDVGDQHARTAEQARLSAAAHAAANNQTARSVGEVRRELERVTAAQLAYNAAIAAQPDPPRRPPPSTPTGSGGGGGSRGGRGGDDANWGGRLLSTGLWNTGALALGSLPAAATGAVNLVGAMQSLIQAGGVMPGVFAGIATSVATAKIGFSGMGDAVKTLSEAMKSGDVKDWAKATEALDGLAPAAQNVAKAIAQDVMPAFDRLKKDVIQQNMFDGVDQSIKELTAKTMPTLEKGLGKVSKSWNGTFKQLGVSLGSDQSQSFMDKIFGNTAEAQTRMSKAIEPLVSAFGRLTSESSDFLPRLADGVGTLATKFDGWVSKSVANGNFDKWINQGIEAAKNLGKTFLNIGDIITSVTKAAGGDGGLLKLLRDGTDRLSEFLAGAEGQGKLAAFFKEGREQLKEWLPILKNLANTFLDVFGSSKEWSDGLMPAIRKLSDALEKIPGLVQGVATAFLAWKSLQGLSALNASLATTTASMAAMPLAAGRAVTGVQNALVKLTSTRALLGAAGIAGSASAAGSDDPWSQGLGIFGGFAAGALAGSVFGPAGVAIGGAIGGTISTITAIMGENERAAREAAEAAQAYADALAKVQAAADALKGSQKNVEDALANSGGVVDATVQDAVAQQLETLPQLVGGTNENLVNSVTAALKGLGGSTNQLASIVSGSGPEFDALVTRLRQLGTEAGTRTADALTTLHTSIVGATDSAAQAAPALQKLADTMTQGDKDQAKYNLFTALDVLPKNSPIDALANSTQAFVEILKAMNVEIDATNGKTLSLNAPLSDDVRALLANAGFSADLSPTGELIVNRLNAGDPNRGLLGNAPEGALLPTPIPTPTPTIRPDDLGSLLQDPGRPELPPQPAPVYGPFLPGTEPPKPVEIPVTAPGAVQAADDVNAVGEAAKALPPEKTITVGAETKDALSKLQGVATLLANIQSKTIEVGVRAPAVSGSITVGAPRARGGVNAVLPGYSPGVDNMLVPLSGGEGILIPEAVRALGPNFVYGINSHFRAGLGRGYDEGGVVGMPPGLSPIASDVAGGVAAAVGPMVGLLGEIRDLLKMTPPGTGSFGSGGSTAVFAGSSGPRVMPVGGSGLQAAIALAQRANGGKYQLGATGGADGTVYDCSGFMSDIFAALTGKPYSGNERYFTTTSDFPSLGFQPGYDPNSAFNIGVSPEHMAGTLAGVNVESGGGGVQFGGNAHGALDPQFTKQYHLPVGMPAGLAGTGAYMGGGPATAKALREAQQRVDDRKWDVDKAKDNLDKVNSDPKKTDRQRMDAQHRYDKSLRELADAQSDLAGKMRAGGGVGGVGGGLGFDPKTLPYGDPRKILAGVLGGIGVTPEDIGAIMGAAAGPVGDLAGSVVGDIATTPLPGPLGYPGVPTAPSTDLNQLVAERNPLALAQAAGFDVPDYSRFGGGPSAQNITANGGPGFDAMGRMYSDTAALVDRTFTSLDAAEKARHDQVMAVLNQVKDRLGGDLLEPVVKEGVSGGMEGMAGGTASAIGAAMGQAAAGPIAAAVQAGMPSGGGGVATPIVAAATNVAETAPAPGGAGGFHSFNFSGDGVFSPLPLGRGPLGNLYDEGGLWPSGTFGTNLSGAPERVLNPAQTRLFDDGLLGGWNLQPMQQHMATMKGLDVTDKVGGDFFGVTQVPILGALVNLLVMVLLRVIGVQIEARDTLNEISTQFREFRGEFRAFDASGRLMNDTSGLVDRTGSSEQAAADERIRILKLVLEGLIKFIIEKIIVPIGKAVANAAINIGSQLASSAISGGLGAAFPGGSVVGGVVGGVVSSAIQAGGSAAVDIIADVGSKLGVAALSVLIDGVGELLQSALPSLTNFFFSGDFIATIADGVNGALSGLLGGITGLFGAVVGGLADLWPFDDGGVATGLGLMPKATIQPERVLSPRQTSAFEEMVRANFGANPAQVSKSIHAPIYVQGGDTAPKQIQESLAEMMR